MQARETWHRVLFRTPFRKLYRSYKETLARYEIKINQASNKIIQLYIKCGKKDGEHTFRRTVRAPPPTTINAAKNAENHTGGLRNKMGIVPRAIAKCAGCQGSSRISPCVSYARNRIPIAYYGFTLRGTLLPLLVESKSTSWTGATSVCPPDCESFIKHSRFCRTLCCKYSSNPLGP